jgi:uncharacterized protein YwbE
MKKSSGMLAGMTTKSPAAPHGYAIDGMATKMGAGEIGRTDPAAKVKVPGGRVA